MRQIHTFFVLSNSYHNIQAVGYVNKWVMNLNDVTKEMYIKETQKLKPCTTFAANKFSKVCDIMLDSEYSDSDYGSDCEYG